MKSIEEVEALKEDWKHDPCWDIADTEGFEEYADELNAFQGEWSAKWEEMYNAQKQAEIDKLKKKCNGDPWEYIYLLEQKLDNYHDLIRQTKTIVDVLRHKDILHLDDVIDFRG